MVKIITTPMCRSVSKVTLIAGRAVKVYVSLQEWSRALAGHMHLKVNGVPVPDIISSTMDTLTIVQEECFEIEWTPELVERAIALMDDAAELGIGDLFPINFMTTSAGELVIIDAAHLIDREDPWGEEQVQRDVLDAWQEMRHEMEEIECL